MPEHEGYIWVVDAAEKYGRSRQWFDTMVRFGKLTGAKFPGDKKMYLKVAEVEEFFSKPTWESKSDQDAG